MKKIKVMHIITRLDRGGSSRVVLDIIRNLKDDFSFSLISGRTKQAQMDMREFFLQTGASVIFIDKLRRQINPLADLAAFFSLLKLIKEQRPDIVHAHTSKAGFLGRLAARLLNIKAVIYMPHGHIFYGYSNLLMSRLFAGLERLAGRWCDKIITLTDKDKQEYLKRKIGREGQFITIANGIDINEYKPIDQTELLNLRRQLSIGTETFVVALIARLEPVKGVEVFLNALPEIKQAVPDLKALIIGDGPLRDSLFDLCKNLGLSKEVLFLGYQEDIKRLLAVCDIFINSSLNEGLGMAILEAGAFKKPCVCTDVGGVCEVVDHEKTGILVKSQQPRSLAEAVIRLYKDKDKRLAMGEQARKKVSAVFSIDRQMAAIASLYQELL